MQPNSRLTHVMRGSSAAVLATFVALFAHVVGGGAVPNWLGIAVPLVLSIVVSVLLVGRRLSLVRLAVAVAASQLLFHTLFVLGTATEPAGSHATEHHHSASGSALGATADVGLGLAAGGVSMWASHALAAVLTVAMLWRGELALRTLWAHARTITAVVVRPLRFTFQLPTSLPRASRTLYASSSTPLVLSQITASTASRRGPPQFV